MALENEQKFVSNIEYAISELRRGNPVVIVDDSGNQKIIYAIESLNLTNWECFAGKLPEDFRLVISAKRAQYFFADIDDLGEAISIKPAINTSIEMLEEIAGIVDMTSPLEYGNYELDPAEEIDIEAVKLAKLAELLPAIFVVNKDLQSNVSINIGDVEKYQNHISEHIKPVASAPLALKNATNSSITVFRSFPSSKEHYAIIIGDIKEGVAPLVRLHSSCYTGDLLSSLACDCRDQLQEAISIISDHGSGVILYLIQEGRGIGLANKIRAYDLKEKGHDTVEANEILGFDDDERPYKLAATMLKQLRIRKVKLLTNNPRKVKGLEKAGIIIEERKPHIMEKHEHNMEYLDIKFSRLGHIS